MACNATLYGKAQEVAGRVLDAFQRPNELPAAIAPLFINRKDNAPCRSWSWGNQFLTALAGTAGRQGIPPMGNGGAACSEGFPRVPYLSAMHQKD